MTDGAPIEVEAFYRYGYRGRDMIAIRAPFAMSADKEFVGRDVSVDGVAFRVIAVARQATGPIQKGEPIGIDVGSLPAVGSPTE